MEEEMNVKREKKNIPCRITEGRRNLFFKSRLGPDGEVDAVKVLLFENNAVTCHVRF